MDLGLRQKDVARELGVTVDTVRNWEVGRAAPALRHIPGLAEFLGYVPFAVDGSLGNRTPREFPEAAQTFTLLVMPDGALLVSDDPRVFCAGLGRGSSIYRLPVYPPTI